MSELSYLEKLLDGVEVEWLPLSKVFNLRNGYTPSKTKKEFWANGDIPWFRMDDIRENGRFLGNSLQKISSCAVKGGKLFPENSILISTSATIGEHALITVPHLANQRFTCLALKESYADCFDIKFLFYYCFSLAEWCRKNTTMSSFASVDMDGFKKFLIPRPCPDNPEKSLAIQSEIVRILDKFTELTAELTAELNMRKKQYNYYRDKLLSFEEGGVEWKTLGEIVKMRAGQHISARNIVDGKEGDFVYPCFGGNGIRGYVKEKSHDGEHLLIGRQGALCGNVQRMKGQFYATEHAVVVSAMQGIDIDWAFHMLTTMNLNQYASKSAQPGLAVGKLQELKLLVPSIERQKYIAKMLDKFDTLTGSITEGLPREIELRQKQYEYYRDLLFSFPKTETASN
ncbi:MULTISPECIES: restriction endonuclease subunit S [Enterobacteriaceae]|nr:restriction endonuclease subunit S [Enterobacter hormaechei]ELN9503449.1 restriction endonuclease subunit S [Citrobacter amalonaticus]HED1449599.1 restriction endonuclease subunit S [Enterobacter hormaechei subsp. steigerwaltii]EHF4989199.1 restriction endonuclease subunit S [Enterobacter hormaechei]EHF5053017.1 restriction endonuclease subunit S [Enterobacter hormaechei]ELW9350969.1 restriction endonuclease subunit S [Citrobacter amalonaticus]